MIRAEIIARKIVPYHCCWGIAYITILLIADDFLNHLQYINDTYHV